jgi:hypothetical protein
VSKTRKAAQKAKASISSWKFCSFSELFYKKVENQKIYKNENDYIFSPIIHEQHDRLVGGKIEQINEKKRKKEEG